MSKLLDDRRLGNFTESRKLAWDWLLENYPELSSWVVHKADKSRSCRGRVSLVMRRDDDNFETMTVSAEGLSPRHIFVNLERVQGRTFRVIGWAYGGDQGWQKRDFGHEPRMVIHDRDQRTRKALHNV
ncbi:hypothetical protein SEA_AIKOCARSON_43 [Gordonia phage AikoCarson]|nr:hypothetical protein SEA_AIKOCARSON_43 [Gordonia phage AikoCarson]